MRQIKFGSTDKSATVRIVDDTDGTPETGVTSATAGLAFNYRREGGLLVNIAGLSDLALLTSAHTDGGLLHIDSGYYRVDVPDLAFAAGSDGVLIEGTATDMVVIGQYVQLVGYDPRTELTAAVLANLDAAVSTRAQPGDAMDLVANAVDAAAIATGAIDADAIAANAITAAKIATDAIGADELAADAVAEIGAYVTAHSAASVWSGLAGTTITIHRGDSLSVSITGLGDISGRSKLWFSVKTSLDDADTASIIQIEETGGLLYLNGAAATVPANGDITVDSEALGNITITLHEVETAKLSYSDNLYYDVQMLTAAGAVNTLSSGYCDITRDVTRATA